MATKGNREVEPIIKLALRAATREQLEDALVEAANDVAATLHLLAKAQELLEAVIRLKDEKPSREPPYGGTPGSNSAYKAEKEKAWQEAREFLSKVPSVSEALKSAVGAG